MFLRRLLLAFCVLITGSLAFAVAAVAAGGGLGPGNYTFTSKSADASFGMTKGGDPGPSWSVSVNQGLNSFKPTKPGGPRSVSQGTTVFVSVFDTSGNGGFGCFVVPDSNFVVNRDFSASLHTTLTADEVCPGSASPVGSKADAVPGGESGLTLPLTVDLAWTATGALNSSHDNFTFQCLNYSEDGSNSFQYVNASGSGSISALAGTFRTPAASVASGSGRLSVHNVLPDACYA